MSTKYMPHSSNNYINKVACPGIAFSLVLFWMSSWATRVVSMFTVHLADVHRSPRRCSQCTVHRVQFTLHNVSSIHFIVFMLAVQHTQLLAIWLSFTSTRQLQHGIATNGHNSGNGRTPRV